MLLKGFLGLEAAAAVGAGAAAVTVDSTLEQIILWAAAIGAIGVLWRSVGRPAVAILKRTADAVESLETLPKWREEHDERLSSLEAEVGLAIPAIGEVQNDVSAIRRELGIGDDEVRSPAPPAAPVRPRRPRL